MVSTYRGRSRGRRYERGGSRGRFVNHRDRADEERERPYGQRHGNRPRGDQQNNWGRSNGAHRSRSNYRGQDVVQQHSGNHWDNQPRQQSALSAQDQDLRSVLKGISEALVSLSDRIDAVERNKGLDTAPVGRPKGAVSAGPSLHKTTNNDFVNVAKGLYKLVQIGHHSANWERLPKSIDERLQKLAADINPPLWDDIFRSELNVLTQSYGEEVRRLVSDHLAKKQAETEVTVGGYDSTDINEAKAIAFKHLTTRLGKRLTDQRRTTLMNDAVSKVGLHRQAPPTTSTQDPASAWTTVTRKTPPGAGKTEVGNSTRKRKVPSITPTSVSNRFDMLSDAQEVISDVEGDSNVNRTPVRSVEVVHTSKKKRQSYDAPTSSGVHIFTGEKNEWHVEAESTDTSVIVIGDSNLRKVRTIPQYWQFNALPGAHFNNVAEAMDRLSGEPRQFTVIIQAGINHRSTYGPDDEEEARRMLSNARRNPTVNEIFFNAVSIPADLGSADADRLNKLNRFMEDELGRAHLIAPLHQLDVNIDGNDKFCIHYDQNTVDLITRKMITHVNGEDF